MKSAKRKPPPKKPKKRTSAKSKSTKKKAIRLPAKRQSAITDQMRRKAGLSAVPARTPGEQAGDLQGLSDSERANSESVDELIEDGNAFEAGVVEGVQEAENSESEVRSREVPEDDVPQEYLDEE